MASCYKEVDGDFFTIATDEKMRGENPNLQKNKFGLENKTNVTVTRTRNLGGNILSFC